MDNLSEHNQFCSSILHFWSAIKNLISAELHAHVNKRVSQNCNTTCEVWVRGYHMAILLANVHHNILLWREVLQRPPVNSQSSKGKWSTKRNVPEMGGAIWLRVPGSNMTARQSGGKATLLSGNSLVPRPRPAFRRLTFLREKISRQTFTSSIATC